MTNRGRSAMMRASVLLFLALTCARNAGAGTEWFVADNLGKVDIVSNDVAVGEVADPRSLFLNIGAVSDIGLDTTKGVLYAAIESISGNPNDATPVVVVDLATLTAIGTITDPNHLITVAGQTWALAVSPDGSRAFFTNQVGLVIADTSTNMVTAFVPIPYAQGVRLSSDGNTAYVKVPAADSSLSVSVVDVAAASVIGSVALPNPVSWPDPGVLNSSSFIMSHDGSTLYVVDGGEVIAIDTSALTVTPVLDSGNAIQIPVGLTVAGRSLYVSNRHPGFTTGNCPDPNMHFASDVVVVDAGTLTVAGTVAIAGDALVWGAIGASLDESEIYVAYSTAAATGSCLSDRVTVGILDPIEARFVGTVSDPTGIIIDAETAIDPSSGRVCTTNADCDDGNVCNGAESCQAGLCVLGTPLRCKDNDPCTIDSCDPVGGCTFTSTDGCVVSGKLLKLQSGRYLSLGLQTGEDITGTAFPANDTADDPVINGASLRVFTTAGDAFDDTYAMPASSWSYLGAPGTNRGYVYRDLHNQAGPISVCAIRNGRKSKIKARGAALNFSLNSNPQPVQVVLHFGLAGRRYCLSFGGRRSSRRARVSVRSRRPHPKSVPEPVPMLLRPSAC
jgi:hypothetical protein